MGAGRGFGPPGSGSGAGPRPEAPEATTGHQPERLRGPFHKGKMIGSFLVKGLPAKGEVQVELEELILTETRLAERSLERERIPAELKEIPRRYFELIQGQR